MNNSSESENSDLENWKKTFNDFDKKYKEAYYNIDKAVKLDEEGKSNEALQLYELGLSLIDKTLSQTLNEPTNPDFLWEKAVVMTLKLRKTRKEIVSRIESINSRPDLPADELPPTYEEVISNSKSGTAGVNNGNQSGTGNTFQLPGSSKADDTYIPPSDIRDEDPLTNLSSNRDGNSSAFISYSDLSQQLKELQLSKSEEILFHCDNVWLYFISPDGRVSSTIESSSLVIARIYDKTCNILDETLLRIVSDLSREISERKIKRHKRHSLSKKHHSKRGKTYSKKRKDESLDQLKRTFLQVGSWVYPLIPSVSPCLRSEFGAFIVPDTSADKEGASVGIIVPEEVRDEVHELFTSLLNDISETGRSRRSVAVDYSSDKSSSRIVKGAAYLAHNLVRGAGTTARFLDVSTPKIIDRINPNNYPQPVNPALQKTVEIAKAVSGKAVHVSDYLSTKICIATAALGRYLSPYIQKQGSRILASTANLSEEEASKKINSMLDVACEAAEGISTIYSGLDTAASILGRSLANNTVQIIEYKYGQSAGALTNDAITTFGNVYYTHHNFRTLKPKGIAKAAVRGTGQALLEDYRNSLTNLKPHDEFQGSGPGDGTKLYTTS